MRNRFFCFIICLSIFILFSGITIDSSIRIDGQEAIDRIVIDDRLNAYQPRSSFVVTGNTGFSPEGFTGNGTIENPFVLQGVSISAPSLGSGIFIRNTSAYFEIRDSLIYSASIGVAAIGVHFDNVTHGSIINCTLTNIAEPIYMWEANNCTIQGSNFYNAERAIRGYFCPWLKISENVISDLKKSIYLVVSGNVSIENNRIDSTTEDSAWGTIELVNCGNMTFQSNHITNIPGVAVYAGVCPGSRIINNTIKYTGQGSFSLLQSNWTIIENNTFQMGARGLFLQWNSHCRAINNTISHMTYEGIYYYNVTDSFVINNTLYSVGYGVIYMHYDCGRNIIYGNRIGWSGSVVDSGLTGVNISHWDDGVSIGNAYSDYVGPGPKTIGGTAGAVDNYPTTFSDSTTPVISSPEDVIMTWNEERIINWTVSDNWPDEYTLYLDGSSIEHEQFWLSGFRTVTVSGLTEGTYNYTLKIQDGAGHSVSDTVWVYVVDNESPSLDSPADMTYEQQTGGHEIVWTVGDRNPGIYRITGNGSTVSDTPWVNGTITHNVDGFSVGVYNFTIVVLDQYNNEAKDTVFVIVEDTTPPLIVSSGDFSYNIGTTGHEISWTLGDLNPHEYRIDGNGSTIGWTAWANGTITLNINGYSVGVYNHTLSVVDDYGNLATNTVFVTVSTDNTPPEVDTPNPVEYEQGQVGNEIVWTVGDINPGTYSVAGNGTNVGWTSWTNGSVTLNVDGLSPGKYNHTILVRDAYGNQVTSTVFVTVTDTVTPDLNSPSDLFYEQGNGGNEIHWEVGDRNPGFYRIDGNVTSVDWTSWTNGTITLNVDSYEIGTYNITITLTDFYGNRARDTVYVIVEDTTSPDLSPHIDIQYEAGDTGNTITWLVNDLNPGVYELYHNGTLNSTAPWNNPSIVIDVDGLTLGYHNFTIRVFDSSGNVVSDSVIVHVFEIPTSTETTEPTTTTSQPTEPSSSTTSTSETPLPTSEPFKLDIPSTILIISALAAIMVLIVIAGKKR